MALALATGNLEHVTGIETEVLGQALQLVIWLHALHGQPAGFGIAQMAGPAGEVLRTQHPGQGFGARLPQNITTEFVRERLPKTYSRELVDVIFEQPYCRISNLVDKQIAQRQAASRYLKELVGIDVLREVQVGKEKLFIHPKLMQLLTRDSNEFQAYA